MKEFHLHLFKATQNNTSPLLSVSGSDPDQYMALSVEGFNHDLSIELKDFWKHITFYKCRTYRQDITVYETIEKFGRAIQIKHRFTVTVQISY